MALRGSTVAFVGAVLAMTASGCSGCGDDATVSGSPNPSTSDVPSETTPRSVDGYVGCSWTWCSDAARACDDFLRSGCGADFYTYHRDLPDVGQEDEIFTTTVAICASALGSEIWELVGERLAEEDEDLSPERRREIVDVHTRERLLMTARCTRNARNCEQMVGCMKGMHTLPPIPDIVSIPEPPPPVEAPPPPLYWELPYEGTAADPLAAQTPWDGGVELMPVDSPSCAGCALERCPTFAYFCFAADGTQHCLNGDCCHSLRKCIRACGGYDPRIPISKFDSCLHHCKVGRPSAIQQLADIQHCADVACKGCEKMDGVRAEQTP